MLATLRDYIVSTLPYPEPETNREKGGAKVALLHTRTPIKTSHRAGRRVHFDLSRQKIALRALASLLAAKSDPTSGSRFGQSPFDLPVSFSLLESKSGSGKSPIAFSRLKPISRAYPTKHIPSSLASIRLTCRETLIVCPL